MEPGGGGRGRVQISKPFLFFFTRRYSNVFIC